MTYCWHVLKIRTWFTEDVYDFCYLISHYPLFQKSQIQCAFMNVNARNRVAPHWPYDVKKYKLYVFLVRLGTYNNIHYWLSSFQMQKQWEPRHDKNNKIRAVAGQSSSPELNKTKMFFKAKTKRKITGPWNVGHCDLNLFWGRRHIFQKYDIHPSNTI